MDAELRAAVARSYAVDLADGRTVFAKSHPAAPPHFFTTEAAGLRWLRDGLGRVAARLAELGGTDEPRARLHGDLWAGNRLVGTDGRHWLIDPAAHGATASSTSR